MSALGNAGVTVLPTVVHLCPFIHMHCCFLHSLPIKPHMSQDPMCEDSVQDSLFHEASEKTWAMKKEGNSQMQETFTWKLARLGG